MKTKLKYLIISILTLQLLLFCAAANAAGETKKIDAVFNGMNIQVNGTNVEADNILYNGTTYVPLRKIGELCNKDITWNAATNTANLVDKNLDVAGIHDVVYVTTEFGEEPALPSTISAVLGNGSIKDVNVKWDHVDTQKPGEKLVKGTIDASAIKALAVVTVNERKAAITTIKDIDVAIDQNSTYTPPAKVPASFDNGTTNEVEVVWSTKIVDTSKITSFIIEGEVKGYTSKVKLNVTVKRVRTLQTVKDIAKYSKSVVYIETLSNADIVTGSGSGFIVTADGKVVTNYHVIDDADKIKVTQEDGTVCEVEGIWSYNEESDIAILKLKGSNFTPVILGDSSIVEMADSVVAIGNPENYKNTVSTGIISGLDRDNKRGKQKDIQFTAGITHGSSGGALFNMYGEVIGITYAGINAGDLSFAIPINEVKTFIESGKLMTVSDVKYTKPKAPANVWLRATTYGSIKLGWDEVIGADYYNVYYSDYENGPYMKYKKTANWYKDYCIDITDLTVNRIKFFKITAVKNGVESDFTVVFSATPSIKTPSNIKFFSQLSDVPMVQGAECVKTDYSDDKTRVLYYYADTIDVEEYLYILEYCGYKFLKYEDGIIYLTRGSNVIAISQIDKYIVIAGKIH